MTIRIKSVHELANGRLIRFEVQEQYRDREGTQRTVWMGRAATLINGTFAPRQDEAMQVALREALAKEGS